MSQPKQAYELEGRELIAEAEGLRVQVLTIGPGQCVPWHRHTWISDTFICLEGPMVLETHESDATIRLDAGERATVPPRAAAPSDRWRQRPVSLRHRADRKSVV